MAKTNKFFVKKIKEDRITVEEERRDRSPFILFFIKNGKLLFTISLLFSVAVFVIAFSLILSNMKDSEIVMYEQNGVVVSIDESDNAIINGTPITEEYASKVLDSNVNETNNEGVVIRIKETSFKNGKIVFYSDKTALVKYNDGSYLRVFPINNNYGIKENGMIDRNAVTKKLTGEIKINNSLGIKLLYLSDGSIEVTKGDIVFFVRNSDITSDNDKFYTNLSMVSVPIKKEGSKIYYSNGTIKENDYIIVDNKKYNKNEVKKIHDGITIIYYENGYAEVIKDNMSLIVEKSDHIVYDDKIFEIVSNSNDGMDIKDIMDIKSIKLKNDNNNASNYMIVLEESNNYAKHNISRRLDNKYIKYNVYINGSKKDIKILDINLKDSKDSKLSFENNTYLIYEGTLDKLSEVSVKIGMWVDYETITNEYMNSGFVGTVKVYVESLS